MTKAEAASLGGRANAAKRKPCRDAYLAARARGEKVEVARRIAGISARTASRYRVTASPRAHGRTLPVIAVSDALANEGEG